MAVQFEELDFRELQSRGGFASEQTLEELLNAFKKANNQQASANTPKARAERSTTQQTQQMGKSISKINPILGALEGGFNLLGKAISGSAGLVAGIAQADGSFRSLVPIVDQATDLLSGFMSKIPIVGGFFASITEAGAELIKLRLTLMDLQVNTFRELSKAGLDLQTDIGTLQERVFAANLSMAEFTQVAMGANDGLRIFGGELDRGVDRFITRLDTLTSAQTDFGQQLIGLGLSSEQVAQEFADFIETNRFQSRMMKMTEDQLTEAMLDRLKSERVIAELTGDTADEQRRRQMELAQKPAFQAALADMQNAAGLTTLAAQVPDVIGNAIEQIIGTGIDGGLGTITGAGGTDMLATIPGMVEGLREVIMAVDSGAITAAEGTARLMDLAKQSEGQVQQLTKLGVLDPKFDALGDLFLKIAGLTNMLDNNEYGSAEEMVRTMSATLEDTTANILKINENSEAFSTETAGILESARLLESGVGEFQSQVARLTGPMDTFITKLIGTGGDLAEGSLFRELLDELAQDYGGTATLKRYEDLLDNANLPNFLKINKAGTDYLYGGSAIGKREEYFKANPDQTPITARLFGGGLFPGMTALVGEAGPELVSMGKSFGEVMNSKDTQNLMGNMKSMMDGIMPALQSGDMGSVISQMESMAPELESSMKTMSGQIQSKVNETGAVDRLESTMNKATSEFQKESMNYAAQNQQTLVKIEKLLKDLLPKAMSGNGYF